MTKRMSVTLNDEDELLIRTFAAVGTNENRSLRAWAERRGITAGESTSEAALLRLLLRAGAESLSEQVLDIAYAQLAVEIETAADTVDSRAARARHLKRSEGTRAR